MFVCGLDPLVGCRLSEKVADVVNTDADISEYRKQEDTCTADTGRDRVLPLYKIQSKWFREIEHNLSYVHNTDYKPTLHVTDVYLWSTEHDEVSVASELVSMEDNSIVSLFLEGVHHPIHSIIQHLPGCKHLTSIYIESITNTQDVELLALVMPQLIHLQRVTYGYAVWNMYDSEVCREADTAVVRASLQLTSLKRIELQGITLIDTLTLPQQPLETVVLYNIEHAHFILSSVWQCKELKCIQLEHITLSHSVTLPPQLQKVVLEDVHKR